MSARSWRTPTTQIPMTSRIDVAARLDMEQFVASLAPGDGEIAELRLLEGREIEDIASELDMRRNAVDQALYRVRKRLLEWLAD